jgi:glycosyltransferase involved in cell wall biosynthesis
MLAIHLNNDGVLDGCAHYRFRIPFEEMRRRVKGGIFDWAPIDRVREWAGNGRKYQSVRLPDGTVGTQKMPLPSDYDMFLMPRFRPNPYEPGEFERIPEAMHVDLAKMGITLSGQSQLIDLMHVLRGRVKVVVEYDDDYFSRSRDLGYEHYELLYDFLQSVSAFTVSTPYLRKLVQKYAPGMPVYVLPNCVNWGEWQGHEKDPQIPDDAIVLALTGSATHYEDWQVLETVLPRILQEYPNVVYVAGAYMPDYLDYLQDSYPDQVIYYEPQPYEQYAKVVRQADIVLAPVVPDDSFNLGKSAIKAIEALSAGRTLADGSYGGAVPITSHLYYYNRVTGGNKRGLTIDHTPDAWHSAIVALIENSDLRMRMARKGHGWVRKNRAIDQQWSQWWNAYRQISRRKT